MATLNDARGELVEQLLFVLDHAMSLKEDGVDPMIPFAVVVVGKEKTIKSFLGDEPEFAEQRFEITIKEEDPDIMVFATDSYLTIDDEMHDAVLIKGYDKLDDCIYLLGQCFIPESEDQEFEAVGSPIFLGTSENTFKSALNNPE